jgi:GNAT superfamily N-acetyltransferase
MTIRVASFDPYTASDQLWAAFNETRRAIPREFWPDEPMLDDAETQREVQTTNPMVEFRRWVAMEGDEVAGSFRAAFRGPGTPDEKDYARFLWAGGGVRAGSRRRGVGTLLLREVHQLMHALDKTVLTISAQTEPEHAFIKHVGAIEKHSTVEQRAIFADLDWPRLRQWEDGAAAQGLAWERHAGRVPRDVLVALLPVFTELFADVPLGGLETGPIRWKMNGYDLWYETLDRSC